LTKTFSDTLNKYFFSNEFHREFRTSTPKSADAELNIAPRLAVARQIINASGQFGR
jgi:hypothetical protein